MKSLWTPHEKSTDTSWRVRRLFMKSSWTPHKESVDTSWRVHRHLTKSPQTLHEEFMDTSRRVRENLTKSLRTPHERSADTSWRVRGIAEKNLWIKGREFEWLAFWESLGLFLSATIISDLKNDGLLCDYNWQLCKSTALQVNTLMRGQSMDILWTEYGCSADRAWTFQGQSMDVSRTEHRCYMDTAGTFCGSLRSTSPESATEIFGICRICLSYLGHVPY